MRYVAILEKIRQRIRKKKDQKIVPVDIVQLTAIDVTFEQVGVAFQKFVYEMCSYSRAN